MTADEHPLTVAFDADDTLWHNEDLFLDVHNEYEELLSPPLWTTGCTRSR